jgi:hypothetical protein
MIAVPFPQRFISLKYMPFTVDAGMLFPAISLPAIIT